MSTELRKLNTRLVLDGRNESKRKLSKIVELLSPDKILIQRLHQKTKELAKPNSLSSRYGLDKFPPHSDFVKYNTPPKLVLLSAPRCRQTETIIYDPSELFGVFPQRYLERCLFLLDTSKPRYVRLLTNSFGRYLFRYNRDIMKPLNNEAKVVSEWIDNNLPVAFKIDWSYYRTAIIDNWGLWHARNICKYKQDSGLVRIAMWGTVNDLDCRKLLR